MPLPMNKYEAPDGRVVVMQSEKEVIDTPKGKFKKLSDKNASNKTTVTVAPSVVAAKPAAIPGKPITSAISVKSPDSSGKPAPLIEVPQTTVND